MTATDPKLETWEQGERRRSLWIAGLAAGLAALLLVVTFQTVILLRRSPVIARIDRLEAEAACENAIQSAFLAAVGQALDRSASDEERAAAMERVRLTTAALVRLADDPDMNPCSISLPPPLKES